MINTSLKFNFDTKFYVRYRSEEISPSNTTRLPHSYINLNPVPTTESPNERSILPCTLSFALFSVPWGSLRKYFYDFVTKWGAYVNLNPKLLVTSPNSLLFFSSSEISNQNLPEQSFLFLTFSSLALPFSLLILLHH